MKHFFPSFITESIAASDSHLRFCDNVSNRR